MSGGFGIQTGGTIARPAAPANPTSPASTPGPAKLATSAPGTQPSALPPTLTRVNLPARVVDPVRPKKPAEPLTSPRDLDMGRSPLSATSLSDGYEAVQALSTRPRRSDESVTGGGGDEPNAGEALWLQRESMADHDFAAGRYRAFQGSDEFLQDLGV